MADRATGFENRQDRVFETAEAARELLGPTDLISQLAQGCNPIRGMAEIALNDSYPVKLRARMFMELAHYVYPKRKTVDVRVAEPEAREQATSDERHSVVGREG